MQLAHTEVKSQTGLSSLRVSCKRALNVAEFVLISQLEKDHRMIETRRLKNVVIFTSICPFKSGNCGKG